MKLAIVGATGLVGNVILKVLEERNFPVDELILTASENSVGKALMFKGKPHILTAVQHAIDARPDIAIFSAGGKASLEYAPIFAQNGTYVIDNSSAWRNDNDKPLIVAGVNDDALLPHHRIIANPNCSTMQMMVPLAPLHRKFGIKRLVVSTYQSFTGTGKVAVDQYEHEKSTGEYKGAGSAYRHQIFANCIPHCGDFNAEGYTSEETKLVNETRKILNAPHIAITATAVRVPVFGGHSEAVNVQLDEAFKTEEIIEMFHNTPGLVVMDNPAKNLYPMPLHAHERDEVFVGRIRRDNSVENGLNLFIVADNLRKGAATNTVQIAEFLIESGRVS